MTRASLIAPMIFAAATLVSMPRIASVQPESPAASSRPQVVTITGEDFRPGLTLHVTGPGGVSRDVAAPDITSQRANTFQAAVLFDVSGTYELTVLNNDGGRSDPFRVKTGAAAQNQPRIDQVSPAELRRMREPQAVTLTGSNFESGLRVDMTDPAGTMTSETAVDRADARSVQIKLTFDQLGPYALRITNPSGGSSNAVTVTVR